MCGPVSFALLLFAYLELQLLFRFGARLGGPGLLLWIVGSAIIGRYGIHHQRPVIAGERRGRSAKPEALLIEPALIFLAGALLVFPGPISDLIGLLLFIPGLRLRAAEKLVARGLHERAGGANFVFLQRGGAGDQQWRGGASHSDRPSPESRYSAKTPQPKVDERQRGNEGEREVLQADQIEVGPESPVRGRVREVNPPPRRS